MQRAALHRTALQPHSAPHRTGGDEGTGGGHVRGALPLALKDPTKPDHKALRDLWEALSVGKNPSLFDLLLCNKVTHVSRRRSMQRPYVQQSTVQRTNWCFSTTAACSGLFNGQRPDGAIFGGWALSGVRTAGSKRPHGGDLRDFPKRITDGVRSVHKTPWTRPFHLRYQIDRYSREQWEFRVFGPRGWWAGVGGGGVGVARVRPASTFVFPPCWGNRTLARAWRGHGAGVARAIGNVWLGVAQVWRWRGAGYRQCLAWGGAGVALAWRGL
eukprot:gene7151-biopygen7510